MEFFPLLAALTLGAEQEDETACRLERLETMVKDVLDHFKAEVRGCVHLREGWARAAQPFICTVDIGAISDVILLGE